MLWTIKEINLYILKVEIYAYICRAKNIFKYLFI